MEPLPIDEHLARIVALARAGRDVVLVAPPGSGKTTRVPAALADARLAGGGGVLVLEPRRIAARLSARRVAEERGERLGEFTGYQVRFERSAGRDTKLLFLTEGLLTRRLLGAEDLPGISCVVFDEFHERSLHADLALGLLREVQSVLRRDLRIVVMSATIDAEAVAAPLAAEVVRAEGRRFPVEVEFASGRDEAPLPLRVARALMREVDRAGGRLQDDALVFLPGVGEILRTASELDAGARAAGFDVLPLYGELSPEAQDRAVRRGQRPRVVLSTNVAETSLTLNGIGLVVDAGLARVPRFDPRLGLDRLVLERISRASAEQRAGRAGRERAGRCIRLYTQGEFREMAERLEPEVLRVDLCEAVLALKAFGVRDLDAFAWQTHPQPAALTAAVELLALLGALDPATRVITKLGRRLSDLPVHPRVGRLLLTAEQHGAGVEGALMAALLEARPFDRGQGGAAGRSDLLQLCDLFHAAERRGRLDGPLRGVDRERRQLERLVSPGRGAGDDALLRAALAAFPDRVAKRRAPGSRDALMAGGLALELDEQSVVRDAPLFVALDAADLGGKRAVKVRLASEVTAEWLEELFPHAIRTEDETVWNEAKGRAEGRRRELYLDLPLRELLLPAPDPEAAAELLAKAAVHPRHLDKLKGAACDDVLARIATLSAARPDLELPPADDALLERAVRTLCAGKTALAELAPAAVAEALVGELGARSGAFHRLVPERLTLPSGRAAPITYRRGQAPLISAKLQEFFGTRDSPRIADGRLVVAIDLLSPSGRSVQITSDLANFWRTLYPKERKELARRYPRHPWPEDPEAATATSRPLPRRR